MTDGPDGASPDVDEQIIDDAVDDDRTAEFALADLIDDDLIEADVVDDEPDHDIEHDDALADNDDGLEYDEDDLEQTGLIAALAALEEPVTLEPALAVASTSMEWPAPRADTALTPGALPLPTTGPAPGPTTGPASDTGRVRRSRRWLWIAAALVTVLGCAYVAGFFLTGARLPAGTTIAGIDVGSMTPAAARLELTDQLLPRGDRTIVLTHDDQSFDIDPTTAGLALDVDASVAAAGGERSWDPRDMVALVWGSRQLDAHLDVDSRALEDALRPVAEAVSVPVTEARITFPEGKAVAREPTSGQIAPMQRLTEAVTSAYLVTDQPVQIPMATVDPAVDSAGLAAAMSEIAPVVIGEPVTLNIGERVVPLAPSAWAPALSIEPVDGLMAPVLDAKALAEPLTDSTTGIGSKAVDAQVDIRDGKVVIIDGRPGVGLQPDEMAERLPPVLTATGADRALTIEAKPVEPTFTTADAQSLGITERISAFETNFPHSSDEYRNINQGRAAQLIDRVIVKPGETFSFNGTVGERTAANGFVSGTVISGGRLNQELGGGVSQVVTTLYNAAFFAGLDDVEHHPHLFYFPRYPVGREATVYWGSLDLRFKNSTDRGVLVKASVVPSTPYRDGTMRVEMWGTKVWDDVRAGLSERRNIRTPRTRYDTSAACRAQAPIGGFDVDVYREFVRGGAVVKRETDTASYQAADRIVCGADPDAPEPEREEAG